MTWLMASHTGFKGYVVLQRVKVQWGLANIVPFHTGSYWRKNDGCWHAVLELWVFAWGKRTEGKRQRAGEFWWKGRGKGGRRILSPRGRILQGNEDGGPWASSARSAHKRILRELCSWSWKDESAWEKGWLERAGKTDGGQSPSADPHIRTNLRWSGARKANKRGETPSR